MTGSLLSGNNKRQMKPIFSLEAAGQSNSVNRVWRQGVESAQIEACMDAAQANRRQPVVRLWPHGLTVLRQVRLCLLLWCPWEARTREGLFSWLQGNCADGCPLLQTQWSCHQLRPLWACLSILHSTPARGRGEGNAFGGTGKVERGEEPHLGPSITQCTGVKGEKPAIWSWYPGLTVWPQTACRAFLWCASSFPKMKNEGAKIFFSALSTRHLFLLHLWVIFYHIYYECLKASLPTGDSEDKNQIYLKSPFIPNIVIDT